LAAAAYRRRIISSFLREARLALSAYPVTIAADLYGVMAWGRTIDEAATGQHIPSIAEQVDVVCPMVYPSHYGRGFAGVDRPADHPADFVAAGCRRFKELAAGRAAIRPWLQAFPYGVKHYDHHYVLAQVQGALSAGADGWCLWNPSGRYDVALDAGTVDLRQASDLVLLGSAGSIESVIQLPTVPPTQPHHDSCSDETGSSPLNRPWPFLVGVTSTGAVTSQPSPRD
jgi:hypothetical protein